MPDSGVGYGVTSTVGIAVGVGVSVGEGVEVGGIDGLMVALGVPAETGIIGFAAST